MTTIVRPFAPLLIGGSASSSDIPYKGARLWLGREQAARSGIGAPAPGAPVRTTWACHANGSRPCHNRIHLSALIGVFDLANERAD
jgi:hypothetical protein